jgi:drug/metabolite transporter (DMT)-like permease
MLKQLTTGLLVLLGILGMAAAGVLLAHRSESAPGADWAIGLILGALSYMIAYGLTHAEPH